MAGDNGSSFPFAAISVVALFLSTTYLGQRAFELWRQPDATLGKELRLSEPPVEARLWEDPLEALSRHRQKMKEACRKDASGKPSVADKTVETICQMGQPIEPTGFKALFDAGTGTKEVTLIAAMLPGAALVGADEVRRRLRYATLAGLNVAGYVPEFSERMRLLQIDRCEFLTGCLSPKAIEELKKLSKEEEAGLRLPLPTEIVFETLKLKDDPSRRAAVLWIDDTIFGQRWLSALANMFQETRPGVPRVELRIVGPSSSDLLAKAFAVDLAQLEQESLGPPPATWEVLTKLRVVSPLSTAPAGQIVTPVDTERPQEQTASVGTEQGKATDGAAACDEHETGGRRVRDCVDEAFVDRLNALAERYGLEPLSRRPFFARTLGTDDLLLERLIEELGARGVVNCGKDMDGKRIVLVSEWDSIYARTFAETLALKLKKLCPIELQSFSFLRGLDGATLEGLSPQARRGGDGGRGDAKGSPIEWPEGRGQADYVRRLVEEILKDNRKKSVQAVGVIGWDVHDKLILLQALRDAFPDRVLFTTDVDARLTHPSVTRYSRNVIVATSLPLSVLTVEPGTTQQGIPKPVIGQFRDAYQTATFLAAWLAVDRSDVMADPECLQKDEPVGLSCNIEWAVSRPTLFEIGRESMVELPKKGVASGETENRWMVALIASAALASIAGMILFGYRAPAMREACSWWQPASAAARRDPPGPTHFVLASLQMAALGYAAAVVAELAWPGRIGAWGATTSAVAAGLGFSAFVFPGSPAIQAFRPALGIKDRRAARAAAAPQFLLLALLVAYAFWLVVPNGTGDPREPFVPLSGISAWPSELLRVLAIVLFAWFLDEAWCRSLNAAKTIRQTYHLEVPQTSTVVPDVLRELTVWFWRPEVARPGPCVDGAALWCEYERLLTGQTRFVRLLFWLALSAILIFVLPLVVNTLSDHAWPEIPARGASDRQLFYWTLTISGLAVLVLIVVVGDVTILTWRFVEMLKIGRTIYPRDTIAHFARKLGPDIEDQAKTLVAADPGQREAAKKAGTDCSNSLLDDWIDVRLLAEHTAAIDRLIVYPFILVALLVVARSRLFDNWDIGGAVLILLVVYMLWSIAMAALLNLSAERARQKALEGMAADELWLKGAGSDFGKIAEAFPGLLAEVKALRKGAFAPFFEQPLVQAILVPLGGAGGVQLLDWLLNARG